VRGLERDARRIDATLEDLNLRISRGFGDTEALQARVQRLETEKEALLAQIPETWSDVEAAYGEINSADSRTRNIYRRTVDQAYEPVVELTQIIAAAGDLAGLQAPIDALAADLPSMDRETADERFKEVERIVGDVAGAGDIRSLLSDARREIDSRSPDPEQAAELVAEAQTLLSSEMEWRSRAERELLPELRNYDLAIKGTIGLRQQPRLPRTQALFVASCSSVHRDISLNF
jgi:chromosome segregation ATPase